jgi:hypothetical protein
LERLVLAKEASRVWKKVGKEGGGKKAMVGKTARQSCFEKKVPDFARKRIKKSEHFLSTLCRLAIGKRLLVKSCVQCLSLYHQKHSQFLGP